MCCISHNNGGKYEMPEEVSKIQGKSVAKINTKPSLRSLEYRKAQIPSICDTSSEAVN